jgi:1-acyl-sn-glycerol-3-phosphate acyltransferase
MQTSLILYAEHEYNASTFTARVITGTGSDMYSAVTGAIGALRGPKHGGANEVAFEVQSRYETLLFRSMFRRMCYVYKRELHWVPFFGWGIFLCGMIPINRARGREALDQVAAVGGQKLRDGWYMILFPEGTRVDPGKQRRYKQGGTHLSVATGVPVVPIAHNAGDVWPRGKWLKKPGTVVISIGTPISPQGLTSDQQMAKVEDWIEGEMRRLFPHQYSA